MYFYGRYCASLALSLSLSVCVQLGTNTQTNTHTHSQFASHSPRGHLWRSISHFAGSGRPDWSPDINAVNDRAAHGSTHVQRTMRLQVRQRSQPCKDKHVWCLTLIKKRSLDSSFNPGQMCTEQKRGRESPLICKPSSLRTWELGRWRTFWMYYSRECVRVHVCLRQLCQNQSRLSPVGSFSSFLAGVHTKLSC